MAEGHRLVSPARVFARPTADQIWLGPALETALSQLSRPTRVRMLVGETSSGKTTLLGHLAGKLADEAVVLPCRGPRENPAAVLTTLLLAADLAPWELSEAEQRNLLTVFVQQRRAQGRRLVIVIDDAHTFTAAAWEEIERLLAFRIDKRPALEVVLGGPPELVGRIDRTRMRIEDGQFCVQTLPSPSQEDLVSYLEWRLRRFEMTHLLTPTATQMIARLGGGRYTAVDVLCQMCLLLLRRFGLDRVDARVARHAVAALAARQNAKLEATATGAESEESVDAPPQGYLLVSRNGKVLTRTALGERILLGRSEHNDVSLASPYLSRHHAAIVGTPEGYYIVDLNSVNGVLLNGLRVDRAVLCDRDLVTLGPFRIKVQIPGWLAKGDPLPALADSLTDTAVIPPEQRTSAASVRSVK